MANIGIHICDISDPCEDSKYAAYLIHMRSPDMPHIWTPDMWQILYRMSISITTKNSGSYL